MTLESVRRVCHHSKDTWIEVRLRPAVDTQAPGIWRSTPSCSPPDGADDGRLLAMNSTMSIQLLARRVHTRTSTGVGTRCEGSLGGPPPQLHQSTRAWSGGGVCPLWRRTWNGDGLRIPTRVGTSRAATSLKSSVILRLHKHMFFPALCATCPPRPLRLHRY